MRKLRKNKTSGITLIALVVTIIVLLILAGISIMMLSGNNGILNRTREAKEQTIVGQEKEQVEMAYLSATTKKMQNNVTNSELQIELDLLVGKDKTEVTEAYNNTFNVLYTETQHNYNINNGKVSMTKLKEDGIYINNTKIADLNVYRLNRYDDYAYAADFIIDGNLNGAKINIETTISDEENYGLIIGECRLEVENSSIEAEAIRVIDEYFDGRGFYFNNTYDAETGEEFFEDNLGVRHHYNGRDGFIRFWKDYFEPKNREKFLRDFESEYNEDEYYLELLELFNLDDRVIEKISELGYDFKIEIIKDNIPIAYYRDELGKCMEDYIMNFIKLNSEKFREMLD